MTRSIIFVSPVIEIKGGKIIIEDPESSSKKDEPAS
jgi:hypothetical protein